MSAIFSDMPNFADQRERFLAAAARANATHIAYPHPMRGPRGEALSTDVAIVGRADAHKRLVMMSGTHGVEGYYGSDSQIALLDTLQDRALPDDTCVVLMHLVNPWGTAWLRRVNEDNVDVNRNYIDFSRPPPTNTAYEALHEIYLCRDLDGPERRRADEQFAMHIRDLGETCVSNIVEAGQYLHPDGIFFGGKQQTWTNRTVRRIMQDHVAGARTAIVFDLHTGAGPYGHPMLMTIAERKVPAHDTAQALYGPWLYTILTAANASSDSGVAATATGYASQALIDELADVELMPLVIECGTYDGTRGHALLRDDHWLHLHGDPFDATGRRIKATLLEHYYPADSDWRDLIALRTRQIWQRALDALTKM
ncbi:DUF2817 domain-containing protein [Paraburkholderia sp.]|uniref:DUF2817 domain-containing protein n=1 Tax=Paraburkholderia sp. TaxID=1926495 RepID=UPI0023925A72|nr:DUF2817 domain-containing protein [Paraburkholderia sp.]MDE1184821.1 DUF2817 domain-containing protein [Paraburkholderia sp.]